MIISASEKSKQKHPALQPVQGSGIVLEGHAKSLSMQEAQELLHFREVSLAAGEEVQAAVHPSL